MRWCVQRLLDGIPRRHSPSFGASDQLLGPDRAREVGRAAAVAVLDTRYGYIRTYYYDEYARKQIINSLAGTIDYNSGIITLNDFRVIDSKEPDGLIRITARPQKGIITSTRDTIITIDETDSASISTELVTI